MKHDNNSNNKNNNEHKVIDSSARSILSISIPILLTTLSSCLLFTVDRFMLAGYSIDSMNAAVMSINFVAVFSYMFVGVCSSAEVYVGQYNGDKQYDQLGRPTWQMLYLSLFSLLIFIPAAYFSEYISALPSYFLDEGLAFQRPLLYFGFLQGVIIAFSAFFVGQGKAKIVTCVVISGTLLNIILGYFFIYKLRMGCRGAATATIIAEISQVIVLASVFFNKNNRKNYKTLQNWKFDKALFLGCIKIGGPLAVGNFMMLLAWYAVQIAVSHVSKEQATIYNVGISIYVFFAFLGDGSNKAIATITANMIGRDDLPSIRKTYRFFVYLGSTFSLFVAIPMIMFPEWILNILNLVSGDFINFQNEIKVAFFLISTNIFLEILMMITWGVLNAGGDTRYPVIANQICIWFGAVTPITICYYLKILDGTTMYKLGCIWLTANFFLVYRRYKSLKWYNKLV